jgi:site-specific DNA-methyltransferase (adenine-specific)
VAERFPRIVIHRGDYRLVLNHVKADMFLMSPPYNLGPTSERSKHRLFGGIRGYPDDLPEDVYQEGQIFLLRWCARHLKPNGTIVYNHKLRRRNKQIIHPMSWISQVPELVLVEEIVWDRGSTHNHDSTMMWNQTERLYVLTLRGAQYCLRNTFTLPQRSDIWRINRAPNIGHPAPMPLDLAKAAILAWSREGDLVVDPVLGSATSAVAARELNRHFEGAEIQRNYYDMAMERLAGVKAARLKAA